MVAVQHANNLTNLYVSERRGTRFSIVLRNTLMYRNARTGTNSIDLYQVKSPAGYFIATQLTPGEVGQRHLQVSTFFVVCFLCR